MLLTRDIGVKKKEKGIKRQRSTKISVIMLDNFTSILPKGKARSNLASKGKIQSLQFTRCMSAQEVKNEIVHYFHVEKFFVLELDTGGHNLIKCADQKLTGQKVVDRNGSLYLCQKFGQVSGC